MKNQLNLTRTAQSCLLAVGLLLLAGPSVLAQSIQIQPYLQDAAPNSIYILWQTNNGEESTIEWGPTPTLGNTTTGIAYPANNGQEMVHEVQLTGLARFTRYYYRVKTGNAISEVYDFKTPPFAADNEDFRILAMSDMQRDGSRPNQFRDVVMDGILPYLNDNFEGGIADNLALIMIPGDLVVTGTNYPSWRTQFFTPAEQLLPHVPLYPVLGNHEYDAEYYFTYFKLPNNGTPGFEEHWWHKDYGNVRMIGLNSNAPYANETQLNWLDDALADACATDSIDFVFAELHHPHKSELWTPGESGFTGEVIARLEEFSSDCGKPSIHFFGHTHGYSRGQSRDHKHLWINVATAGGAIDNWGEFPNFDYDEFSVSQDEYGFVMVEIINDDDPRLVVKRISRGDQDTILDNVLTDSLTVRLSQHEIVTPQAIFPTEGFLPPECVVLRASPFDGANQAQHGQSHWQIDLASGDFSTPVIERWKNFENWYFDIDTQSGDDLTDETIMGLAPWTIYQWRVRYRDREMNWSAWSTPAIFSTEASISPSNLLTNIGAEDDLIGWTVLEGVVESLESNVCNGIPAYAGGRYFAVGGLCNHSAVAQAVQKVDVNEAIDSIDAGNYPVQFGGYLSNFGGSDRPEMWLIFRDANEASLGESQILTTLNNSWTLLSGEANIPVGTRSIDLMLKGTRNSGTDNDSYFDELFLYLGPTPSCEQYLTSVRQPVELPQTLRIAPNPASTQTTIMLPIATGEYLLYLTDASGKKYTPACTQSGNQLTVNTEELPANTYFVWLRNENRLVGSGKMVIVK